MSAGIMIAGAENVRKVTVLQVVHALALEVATSLKISSRMSALQAAKLQGVVPENCRSKKKALVIAVELMKELDPTWEPRSSVKLALSK